MSHVYDNWEKLVTAVLKREQYWQLCHSDSLSSSSSSVSSDFSPSSSRRLSFDIPPDHLIELTPEDGHFKLHTPISYPSSQLDSGPKPPKTPTGWRIGRIAGAARQFFTPATMRRQSQMPQDLLRRQSQMPQEDIIETGTVENLPMFRDVPVSKRQSLFLHKVQICFFQFDFTDTMKLLREKEIKRQTLEELVDFIQSGSGKITKANQEEMVRMISANIFRCLPPASHENTGSEITYPEQSELTDPEDEPYLEPSWSHLQLVYELLLRYVASSDTKVAGRYIDHSFVLKLLDMFDIEDQREREYLKTVLHRIYGKFMEHRPFIRKVITNIFYRFIYETERHSGIAELLEILGSIINGFVLPVKEEHKLFLVRALIPLHKPKPVAVYHQQLSYCMTQFVEKDNKLADTVIRGLLKYWPVTNCQKEVLFLGELEEVLEATQASEFQRCMVPLFRQIARCLNSSHFQVAERALFLWNNDHIVGLIAQNRSVILPIIFEGLEKNIQSHWNQAVHGLSVNVRKMFMEMDTELFEECQRQHAEKEAKARELEENRELTWQRLEIAAAQGR